MEGKKIHLYFDGACQGNAQKNQDLRFASYGWLIQDSHLRLLEKGKGALPKGVIHGNNIAEFTGLEEGLKAVLRLNLSQYSLICYSDSQLVVTCIKKDFTGKKDYIRQVIQRIKELLSHIPDWDIQWIPRKENKLADALSTSVPKPDCDIIDSDERLEEELSISPSKVSKSKLFIG